MIIGKYTDEILDEEKDLKIIALLKMTPAEAEEADGYDRL